MQKLILTLLAFFARAIILFHKPVVIGITGTVWKTTVTSHIKWYLSHVLSDDKIGYSQDHYNGEYGLPLTIIWAKTGGKNPFRWMLVFCIAITRFFRPYPKYLILEYGIDHPGEMDFLTSIAVPDIAIITEIAPNHLEQFWSFHLYRAEKMKIAKEVKHLIVHDSHRNIIEWDALFYGSGWMSDIDISDVVLDGNWTSWVVHFHEKKYSVAIKSFGSFHLINILPLYAIAEILSCNIESIPLYIQWFQWEAWRSTLLEGKFGSKIIDGSYNGWYLSLHAGILSLESFLPTNHLICIIGDMRELGNETESLHIKLAEEIVENFSGLNEYIHFYLVGPYMHKYVFQILSEHFHTVHSFSSRDIGNDVLRDLSQMQDPEKCIIYVKWSQNTIFLEEAVQILLNNPSDIKKLCRQSSDWKKKKEIFFQDLAKK